MESPAKAGAPIEGSTDVELIARLEKDRFKHGASVNTRSPDPAFFLPDFTGDKASEVVV